MLKVPDGQMYYEKALSPLGQQIPISSAKHRTSIQLFLFFCKTAAGQIVSPRVIM